MMGGGEDVIKGLLAKMGVGPELGVLKEKMRLDGKGREKTTAATMAAAEQQAGLNREDQLQQMIDALSTRGMAHDIEAGQRLTDMRQGMIPAALKLTQGGPNVLATAQLADRKPSITELIPRG